MNLNRHRPWITPLVIGAFLLLLPLRPVAMVGHGLHPFCGYDFIQPNQCWAIAHARQSMVLKLPKSSGCPRGLNARTCPEPGEPA